MSHIPFPWAPPGHSTWWLWGGGLGSAWERLVGPGHNSSFAACLWVSAALLGLGLHRARGEASASLSSLLLHPSNAQAVCSDPRPLSGAKSIHPSAERLPWYRFQREEVFCQPASSQQGCGRVFWVRLCRELFKCFVLMMMMIIIFFPR